VGYIEEEYLSMIIIPQSRILLYQELSKKYKNLITNRTLYYMLSLFI